MKTVLSRRLFMRKAGVGAAAAPFIAPHAALGVSAAPAYPTPTTIRPWNFSNNAAANIPDDGWKAREVLSVKKQMEGLLGKVFDPTEWHGRSMMLDPDLACNRSLALHAKMREQARRNFERQSKRERGWLQSRLAELIG